MHTILQEARIALRTSLKSPAFAGLAIMTLALGIGVLLVSAPAGKTQVIGSEMEPPL